MGGGWSEQALSPAQSATWTTFRRAAPCFSGTVFAGRAGDHRPAGAGDDQEAGRDHRGAAREARAGANARAETRVAAGDPATRADSADVNAPTPPEEGRDSGRRQRITDSGTRMNCRD